MPDGSLKILENLYAAAYYVAGTSKSVATSDKAGHRDKELSKLYFTGDGHEFRKMPFALQHPS